MTLSFRMRMPDGRCLTEWPDFYAAIKEFAFFIRDDRYARINDAGAHTASVYALMAICHGLALDGFSSFIHVNAKVLKQFLPRIVRGNEGIIKASDRLRHWLAKRERADGQGLRSGLPLRAHKEGTAHLNTLDNARLMELARLPESACKLPRVAYLCQEASREAGLTCQTNPTAKCPEEVKLSVQALYRYLNALQLLYVMRGRIAAVSLPDRPFTNASDVAKKHGSETIPTPIPPAALALHLIAHAMLWVSNYSDPLVALWKSANDISHHNRAARYRRRNAFAELVASTPTEGPEGSPWPLSEKPVKVDSQQLSCQAAIRLLFAACFILIGTFSARRKNEVRDLTADDLDDTDVEEILLRPFIEKTLQRKDWIPVPGIVARAFRVLEALSSSARAETGCPSLFQWTNPFLARPGVMTNSMQANVAIDEFARWVKTPQWAPPGQEPTEWHWTPHQFRKFFAVLYFYRYRGATIEVLAHFLRHFNLEMTKQYLLLNPEAKHVFDQVEWGFRQQVARTIALKGDAVQGGMAKRLAKQWIDKLRTSVRITSPTVEEAEAYIDRQMRRSKLVLTPKPWVDCSCPRTTDAAKAASCRAGASIDVNTFGPDFARAGPCVCADCPFSMDNGRLEESVAEELLGAERISVSEMGAGTLLAGILKERIVKLHRYQPAAGVQGAANV